MILMTSMKNLNKLLVNKFRKDRVKKILPITIIGLLGIILLLIYKIYLNNKTYWWKVNTDGETFTFKSEEDTVYFGNTWGTMYAMNKKDGKIIWQYKTDYGIFSYPQIYRNILVIASNNGILYGLDKKSGVEIWRYDNQGFYNLNQPLLEKEKVYFSDTVGNLRSIDVNSGKERWSLNFTEDSNKKRSTDSAGLLQDTIIVENDDLYYAGINGTIYSLNKNTGKTNWEYSIGDEVKNKLFIYNDSLFVSTDKQIFAINKKNGKELWKLENGSGKIKCFQKLNLSDTINQFRFFFPEQYLQLTKFVIQHPLTRYGFIVNSEGEISMISLKKGNTIWKTYPYGKETSCVEQFGPLVVLGNKHMTSAINLFDGQKIWENQLPNRNFSKPIISADWNFIPKHQNLLSYISLIFKPVSIFNTDSLGNLYAYTIDGKLKWDHTAFGKVNSFPLVEGKYIYDTSTNGSFFILNKETGEPPIPKSKISLEQSIEKVGQYNIHEFTIHFDDKYYDNPWQDISVTAEFQQNSDEVYSVDGFYYDKNIWKVRFNPTKKGNWKFKITFKAAGNNNTFTGGFSSDTETSAAFLKIYEKNKRRLTLDNKTIFNGIGIGDIIRDYNQNGSPLDDWFIEEEANYSSVSGQVRDAYYKNHKLDLNDYLNAYAQQGGFNLYRWSVDNSSFNLWKNFTINNKFLIAEGKYGDEFVKSLKIHNFQIWMTIFGFEVPFGYQYPNELKAMKQYIRYIIARYGAYVSIWEIANEAYTSESQVKFIANEIAAADPEKRPISMSHIWPNLQEISIISPHWYFTEQPDKSDIATTWEINKYLPFYKPIIFGEQGNSVDDDRDRSRLRMRVRSWTAFFNESMFIFWNQSDRRTNPVAPYVNANLYIGEKERKEIQNLQKFTKNIDISAEETSITVDNSNVRGYSLSSEKELMGYFYHFTDQQSFTFFTTTLHLKKSGEAIWYDPEKGEVIAKQQLLQGDVQITSPNFTTDIAVKVTYNN